VDNWFVQGKVNGEMTVGLLSTVMVGNGGVGGPALVIGSRCLPCIEVLM
jgi:hypothetical protein